MSKNSDLKATIKALIENVQLGNKSGSEVAQSVNIWLKEGGEAIKVKIEDEVERSVSKMGFVKRGEFEALKQEVAALKNGGSSKKSTAKKSSVEKTGSNKTVKKVAQNKATKKKVTKRTVAKKSAVKRASR
jgi:BMFP domain-containing protein YqiC